MDNLKHWRIEQQQNGFSKLIIDKADADQNALSSDVVAELDVALSELKSSNPRGVILASGKPSSFIVGADINEFTQIENEHQALEMVQKAHGIFSRLEQLGIPTVAMINGHCLGGGLELALACKYRVMVNDTDARIGLPEVMLGIHPGFGGTARLIATIGAPAAMDLMLTGRGVRAKQARGYGIVDMAVPQRHLQCAATLILEKSAAARQAPKWNKAFDFKPARSVMAGMMRKKVRAKAAPEHYPAPFALIDLWQQHGGNKKEMLAEEAKSISKLITGDSAQNLVRVFFLQERLKSLGKSKSNDNKEVFNHVHVIGGGVMGGDIAAWCALQGLTVTLQDQNPEALARANARAHTLFKRKLRDRRRVMTTMDRLQPDLSGNGVERADVIIEAIFENAEAKQGLFKDIESRIKEGAILATNTSSIPLETISSVLQRPERLIGLHFFNPVAKMQLVEIVAGADTSAAEAQRGAVFTRQIGRLPVPVKSSPGFLVNRILTPYLMEAVELYREGVPAAVIDKAATKFGMPMGPIELADTVGLDIATHVAKNLAEAFGEDTDLPPELQSKLDAKQLGKKTGRGFYIWSKGKPQKPEVPKDYQAPGDITDRMVFRYLNESVACLFEEVVDDYDLLDAGMIFGTGFAPFRGGPMHYIEQQGRDQLHQHLQSLAEKHGPRFTPNAGWVSRN